MKPVVAIGLGNLLMSDEGIGVRVVQELLNRKALPPDVEIMDLGTGGLNVLHALTGRRKAVFIDCGFMDKPAGILCRFTPKEVISRKVQTRFSVHEGDLMSTLELARTMNQCPEEIVVFAIQPAIIEPGMELSSTLSSRLAAYTNAVVAELAVSPLSGAYA